MDAFLFLTAVGLGIILGWLLFGALPPLPQVTGAHSADDDEPEDDDDWLVDSYLLRNETRE